MVTNATGDLFQVNYGSSGWLTFQDLTVAYSCDGESGGNGTAFNIQDCFGCRLFRVNVVNCANPFVVNAGSTNLLQCTASYTLTYPVSQPCVGLLIDSGPAQVYIEQCAFTCPSIAGSIGIHVGHSYWARISDTNVSGFATGISLKTGSNPAATGLSCHGMNVDAVNSCVSIQYQVYDITFVDCSFQPTSGSAPGASGILLSSSGNGDIDTVRFIACSVSGYPVGHYGVEIATGQNLQIIGGNYSGNGTAGIAITGPAAEVQIDGANCIGPWYGGNSTPLSQQYGIYIAAGSDIQIIGTNCSGNGTSSSPGAGIYFSGDSANPITSVRIVGANCAGPTLGGTSSHQQYGVYASEVSGILIDGCVLTGNNQYAAYLSSVKNVTIANSSLYSSATSAVGIYVTGTTANPTSGVYIRNCNGLGYSTFGSVVDVVNYANGVSFVEVTNTAGYNDVTSPLYNSATPITSVLSGAHFSYYGGIAVYLAASSTGITVTVDGNVTHLTSGLFNLSPTQNCQVAISGGTVTWMLVMPM